jgi:hypothetical protein
VVAAWGHTGACRGLLPCFEPPVEPVERHFPVTSLLGLAPVPLVLGVLAAGGVTVVCVALGRRPSAAAREKKRRLAISANGRMADAMIEDIRDDELYYSYSVRGVHYAASQDVADVRGYLPPEGSTLIGPATVKYQTSNPANSILVAENWSGLRAAARQEKATGAAGGKQ